MMVIGAAPLHKIFARDVRRGGWRADAALDNHEQDRHRDIDVCDAEDYSVC